MIHQTILHKKRQQLFKIALVRSGDNPDFIDQEIHECYVTVPEINEAPKMHNDDEPTIPNSSYSRSDTQ